MLHYQQLDLRLPPALGLLDDAPVGIAYLLIGVTLLINSLWDFYWYRIRIILIALSGGMWTLLTASYAMNDIGRATYSMNRGERDGEDIGGTLGFDCSGFVYHVLNYAGAWNDSYLQRAHYTGTLKNDLLVAGFVEVDGEHVQAGDVFLWGSNYGAGAGGVSFSAGQFPNSLSGTLQIKQEQGVSMETSQADIATVAKKLIQAMVDDTASEGNN